MLRTLATLQIGLFIGLTLQAAEVEDRLPTPPDGKSWKLIWHDEFDGNRLDESKWEPRPGVMEGFHTFGRRCLFS